MSIRLLLASFLENRKLSLRVLFVVFSGIATIADFLIFNFLLVFSFSPIIANAISLTSGSAISFILNRKSYGSQVGSVKKAFFTYLGLGIGSFFFSTVFILLVENIYSSSIWWLNGAKMVGVALPFLVKMRLSEKFIFFDSKVRQ